MARINAILKRTRASAPAAPEADVVRVDRLEIDIPEHRATWDSEEIALTATEFQILLTLAQHPRRVFSREDLMRAVYAPNIHVSDRTLDSHVRHVRAKLGAGLYPHAEPVLRNDPGSIPRRVIRLSARPRHSLAALRHP